jgi:hypothetical protein
MNIDRVICFLKAFVFNFVGLNIKTSAEAQRRGLSHCTNVFGDGINITGCRSMWIDRYGNKYKCDELLEGGWDVTTSGILWIQKIFLDSAMRQLEFTGNKTLDVDESVSIYYKKGIQEGEEVYVLL